MTTKLHDPRVEALLAASRALVGIAIRSVQRAPVQVTVPQHRVLSLLEDNGPLGIGAIAAELGVNPSNASRVCDRLQALGLIERNRSENDRRSVLVALSDAGRHVVETVTENRRAEIGRLVARLDDSGPSNVTGALEAVSAAARDHEMEELLARYL